MANWSSLSEINSTLGLGVDLPSLDSVRDALRQEIARVHPDRNGGSFTSNAEATRFHDLNAALEFCNRPPSTALVPIQDIPALVAAVRQALAPEATVATSAQQRAEHREVGRREVHEQVLLPRIGSGIFSGVCGALLTFAGELKDNVILGPMLATPDARAFLAMMFFGSGILFIWTWWSEQRQNARLEWLATDEGRREILARTLRSADHHRGASTRFAYSDVIDAIRDDRRSPLLLLLPPSRISPTAAERLANLHLEELERRGIIKKTSGPSLDPEYEVETSILEQIAPRLDSRRPYYDRWN
jgi:hypothetical protein